MPTPPLIDIEALAAPIPGENPAGKAVPFAVREQLEASRKEVDLRSFAKTDPLRPTDEQRADWPKVIAVASQTLTNSSKDLLIVARLTEALTKRYGFPGLRDGLGLMRKLVDECWERLYPPIEEPEDAEVRAAAFTWLCDQDRGARFPSTIRGVPLLAAGDAVYTWYDWKLAQVPPKDELDEKPAQLKAAFDKTVQNSPRELCQAIADDLRTSLAELSNLDRILDSRIGEHAPALSGLREAVEQCSSLADQILLLKGPAPAPPPAPVAEAEIVATDEPGEAVSAQNGSVAGPPAPRPSNRAQLYQQIAETSAALKVLEPHSPIPYLLERAVELGALSFPELMKVLINNPDVLAMMNRELGLGKTEGSA